ncbi:serine hydrolase domain-containing protein [Petropleomorpha daqingensis]|uniref:CubicO group peptidase (Beta-lactamase class C family) n=1 Tax=Petropleomorpha daqingensis TaxID=2026353 RepID=A0A853CN94_9ACTN|nr:serine hydrolase domain-containing protein [Petropleomorpha daqingensis]NYJ08279.1 CubicO group peptidase (beta-lactamase class C family) [Petropleomorpha daqingensis]
MGRRLDDAGLERFGAVSAAHVGETAVPGLVALVACGDEVHVEALGTLTIGGPPVERGSLFRIASTTKTITAAATLALVGEGLVELDEPVERLLPELAQPRVLRRMDGPLDDTVPATSPVTARGLLAFTFGFGMAVEILTTPGPWPVVAAAAEAGLATIGPPQPDDFVDPETWIARFGELPLMAQPGERWLYNTGCHVLGVLCARAAGLPFEEVLRTRVLDPLGMRDTTFSNGDLARLATAYQPTPDGLVVWDPPAGQWSRPPAFPDGAAGLLSTADDLLAFARMLLRGGDPVLTADQVRELGLDHLSAEQRAAGSAFLGGRGWGLGTSVVREGPWAGAIGWDGGLGTSFLVHPERDLAVIVLTQRLFDTPQAPAVHTDLQAAALAAVR